MWKKLSQICQNELNAEECILNALDTSNIQILVKHQWFHTFTHSISPQNHTKIIHKMLPQWNIHTFTCEKHFTCVTILYIINNESLCWLRHEALSLTWNQGAENKCFSSWMILRIPWRCMWIYIYENEVLSIKVVKFKHITWHKSCTLSSDVGIFFFLRSDQK